MTSDELIKQANDFDQHITLPIHVRYRKSMYEAATEIELLLRQVAALRNDAARYRWLRDQRGWPLRESPGGSSLDSYIDAAIAESAK